MQAANDRFDVLLSSCSGEEMTNKPLREKFGFEIIEKPSEIDPCK
jgi:hypothetical protein